MASTQFFTLVTIEDGLQAVLEHLVPLSATEHISVERALGRVVATAPTSPHALPTFVRSTMDGYAVRAADTFGATQSLPAYLDVVGSVHMGSVPSFSVGKGQAAEIHTGAMLPDGADAVVMVEKTQISGDNEIEVMGSAAPGENLVQIGEDVEEGQTLLERGQRIRPQEIGGLVAVGITELEVMPKPRVAVLSCGDELVQPHENPALGQIRDINGHVLAALVAEAGAEPVRLGIARDTVDSLLGMARDGLSNADMLVLSAGSSVGSRDLTRTVIEQLGEPGVLRHGLAVKPGKPTVLAVCDGKPVIGLPGNPVSATLVARQIILPILRALTREPKPLPAVVKATLGQNIASYTGRYDSVPVRLVQAEAGWVAEPVFGKSNLIYRLVNADGLIYVPLDMGGLKAGETVHVTLF